MKRRIFKSRSILRRSKLSSGRKARRLVYLNSPNSTFTQLAELSAENLPSGVTASFEPANITAGANSTLTLNLANAAISSGSYSFTVRAKATIDGREVFKEATATVSVLTAGQTTLSGRVLNTDSEPVIGATVSLDGRSVTTDSSGSFTLSGVTAGQARPLQIDGRTASAPNRTYPVITEHTPFGDSSGSNLTRYGFTGREKDNLTGLMYYRARWYDAPDFENVLAVRVSNVSTDNIPPSATADVNFYGGIYRDVYLIATDPVHISVTDYASPGVYIDTPQVSEEKASVRFKGKIINDSRAGQKIKVKNSVLDKENVKIADTESVFEIEAGREAGFIRLTRR